MDFGVTGLAHHERFAMQRNHPHDPIRFGLLAAPTVIQVREFPNVMHFAFLH